MPPQPKVVRSIPVDTEAFADMCYENNTMKGILAAERRYLGGASSPTTSEISIRSSRLGMPTTKVKLLSEIREEEEQRERDELIRLADEADEAAAKQQREFANKMTTQEANQDIESYLHSFDHLLTNRSLNSSQVESVIAPTSSGASEGPNLSSPTPPSLSREATEVSGQHLRTTTEPSVTTKKVARRIAIEFTEEDGLRPVPGSAIPYGRWTRPTPTEVEEKKHQIPDVGEGPINPRDSLDASRDREERQTAKGGRRENTFADGSSTDDDTPLRPSFISEAPTTLEPTTINGDTSQTEGAPSTSALPPTGHSRNGSLANSVGDSSCHSGGARPFQNTSFGINNNKQNLSNSEWMSQSALTLLSRSSCETTAPTVARPNMALALAAKLRASKSSNRASALDWASQDSVLDSGILMDREKSKENRGESNMGMSDEDIFNIALPRPARSIKATLLLGAAVGNASPAGTAGEGDAPHIASSFAVICDAVGVDSGVSKELFIHESKFRKAHQRAQHLQEQLEQTRNELRARRLKALKQRNEDINSEESTPMALGAEAPYFYLGANVFGNSDEEDEDDDLNETVPESANLERANRLYYWNESLALRGRTSTGEPSSHSAIFPEVHDGSNAIGPNVNISVAILQQAMEEMEEEAEAKGRLGVLYNNYADTTGKSGNHNNTLNGSNPFLLKSYQSAKKKLTSGILLSPKHQSKKALKGTAGSGLFHSASSFTSMPTKLPPVARVANTKGIPPPSKLGGYATVEEPRPMASSDQKGVQSDEGDLASMILSPKSGLVTSLQVPIDNGNAPHSPLHTTGFSPAFSCVTMQSGSFRPVDFSSPSRDPFLGRGLSSSQLHSVTAMAVPTLSSADETIIEELSRRIVLIKERNMKTALEEAKRQRERLALIRRRGGHITLDNLDGVLQGGTDAEQRLLSSSNGDKRQAENDEESILVDALRAKEASTTKAYSSHLNVPSLDPNMSAGATTGLTDDMIENRALEKEYEHLEPFLKAEETMEVRRFLAEKWLVLVVLMKSLAQFTKQVEYQKAYHAIETVGLPLLRRRLRTWRRAREIREEVAKREEEVLSVRPDPREVKRTNSSLFFDWPVELVQEVLDRASYVPYEEKSVVFHEGDPSKQIYIIVSGAVEISIRHGRTSNPKLIKSRFHESNHTVVATLRRGSVFGEMASLTGELRCASARCLEDCDLLRISHTDFFRISTPLSNTAWNQVVNACLETRRGNISKVFPLSALDLHKQEVFSGWSTAALCDVTPRFTPVFFSQGSDIFVTRKNENCCIVIVRGEVRVTPAVRGKFIFGPGEILGEDETIMARSREFTAVASRPTEAYILTRDNYIEAATDNAAFNNTSRNILAERQASRILKGSDPPLALIEDPLMSFLFDEAFITKLWAQFAKPRVVWQSSLLFAAGNPCDTIYVVVKGTFHERLGGEAVGYEVATRERHRLVRSVTKQHKKLKIRNEKMREENWLKQQRLLVNGVGEGAAGVRGEDAPSPFQSDSSSSSSEDDLRQFLDNGENGSGGVDFTDTAPSMNPFFEAGRVQDLGDTTTTSRFYGDNSSSSSEEEYDDIKSLGAGLLCASSYLRKKSIGSPTDSHSPRRLKNTQQLYGSLNSTGVTSAAAMKPRPEVTAKIQQQGSKAKNTASSTHPVSVSVGKKPLEAYFAESGYPSHQQYVVGSADPEDQLIGGADPLSGASASRASSPQMGRMYSRSGGELKPPGTPAIASSSNNLLSRTRLGVASFGSASCSISEAPPTTTFVNDSYSSHAHIAGNIALSIPRPRPTDKYPTSGTSTARDKQQRRPSDVELAEITTAGALMPFSPLPNSLLPPVDDSRSDSHLSVGSLSSPHTKPRGGMTPVTDSYGTRPHADAVVLGSLELAIQHPTYLRTVWCTSECVIYELPIKSISRQLSMDYPGVLQAMVNPTTRAKVLDCLGSLQT